MAVDSYIARLIIDILKSSQIEMAMELKVQNVRYTWGGKSVDEGFDSAAFIAYILARAGIHQAQALKDPDLWQIGILRSNVGGAETGGSITRDW